MVCCSFSDELVRVQIQLYSACHYFSYAYLRSLKKKVGEYEKLTGELPGIWRCAFEAKDRAIAAEKVTKMYIFWPKIIS